MNSVHRSLAAIALLTPLAACTSGAGAEAPTAYAPALSELPAPRVQQLAEGELEVSLELPGVENADVEDGPTPWAEATARYVVTLTGDNVLRGFDKTTMQPLWESEASANAEEGPCFRPFLDSEDTSMTLLSGEQCNQVETRDVATGEVLSTFEYDGWAENATTLGGRTWFTTNDELYYISDEGEPVRALDANRLRVDDWIAGLSVLPEDNLLVLQLGSRFKPGILQAISVNDTKARPSWRVRTDRLGITASRKEFYATLVGGLGGAALSVEPAKGRSNLGVLNPENGHVLAAIDTYNDDHTGRIEDEGYDPATLVQGGLILVPTSEDGEVYSPTGITAFDVETGRDVWTTSFTANYRDVDVETVQLSSDGTEAYVLVNVEYARYQLHRVRLETGSTTGTWELPAANHEYRDTRVQVFDNVIVVTHGSYLSQAVPLVTLIRAVDE